MANKGREGGGGRKPGLIPTPWPVVHGAMIPGVGGEEARGSPRRSYSRRILPFDLAVARVAGRLSDQARGQGQAPGFADIAIAATARHHGLTILTRNLRHFAPLGVDVIDPFSALPR